MDGTQTSLNSNEDIVDYFFPKHVVSPPDISTYLDTYFSLYPNLFDRPIEGKFSHDDSLENSSGPIDFELHI